MTNQNPYNQPQMQPKPNRAGQDGRRQQKKVMMMGKRLFPKWLSQYPMMAYVAALMVLSNAKI